MICCYSKCYIINCVVSVRSLWLMKSVLSIIKTFEWELCCIIIANFFVTDLCFITIFEFFIKLKSCTRKWFILSISFVNDNFVCKYDYSILWSCTMISVSLRVRVVREFKCNLIFISCRTNDCFIIKCSCVLDCYNAAVCSTVFFNVCTFKWKWIWRCVIVCSKCIFVNCNSVNTYSIILVICKSIWKCIMEIKVICVICRYIFC